MSSAHVQAVILAAGRSSRFNNDRSKLVEPLCGKQMLIYTTELLAALRIPTIIVVGHKRELVQAAVAQYHPGDNFSFVHQQEQLGTGHALQCTKNQWTADHILVLNGDAPLLTREMLQDLIEKHVQTNAAMSFIVATNIDPSVRGYGIVITHDMFVKIVEERHLPQLPHDAFSINGGIYIFNRAFLQDVIDNLPRHHSSGEFYLTTLAEIASEKGLRVNTVEAPFDKVRGVNTLRELWVAEHIKRSEAIERFMANGVRFSAAHNVHVDALVHIGAGTTVGCGVQLFGATSIGQNVHIGPFVTLRNAVIGDNCVISSHASISDSILEPSCTLQPFVVINHHSVVKAQATIASFSHVERCVVEASVNPARIIDESQIIAASSLAQSESL